MLTDTAVRTSKPRETLYKVSDGRGLQLHITPQGSKLWRWAYRFDGKQKLMALGGYPDVSLAQARDWADQARKLLATGTDPMAERKAEKIALRTPLAMLGNAPPNTCVGIPCGATYLLGKRAGRVDVLAAVLPRTLVHHVEMLVC